MATSLRPHHRWWLERGLIPKCPEFRLVNYNYNLPRYIINIDIIQLISNSIIVVLYCNVSYILIRNVYLNACDCISINLLNMAQSHHDAAWPWSQAPYATESPNTVKGVASRRRTYHENYESTSERPRETRWNPALLGEILGNPQGTERHWTFFFWDLLVFCI